MPENAQALLSKAPIFAERRTPILFEVAQVEPQDTCNDYCVKKACHMLVVHTVHGPIAKVSLHAWRP